MTPDPFTPHTSFPSPSLTCTAPPPATLSPSFRPSLLIIYPWWKEEKEMKEEGASESSSPRVPPPVTTPPIPLSRLSALTLFRSPRPLLYLIYLVAAVLVYLSAADVRITLPSSGCLSS
ncbi:hypothetical protein E2C01_052462 [Portunus trituberculatus]|uniref:Uncharacterized protein n=1 Tax=Portunus trituberculatus TaxID=210409 RepID=A0A5B7GMI6_PORTR|nr:hypothetical protein [Portunus trituberculatus]